MAERAASVMEAGTPREGGTAEEEKLPRSQSQIEGFEDMKDDPMLQLNESQWLAKGLSFSAVSRPGAARTPPWSFKRKLKIRPDPKLFLLRNDGMQTMQKGPAMGVIQDKIIRRAVREADHKKRYAEQVVTNAKRTFEEADEDGGGSLDVEELVEVVKMMREEAGNPVRSMDEKIKLHIEATEAVSKYGTLDYDERGVEMRAITFDGFLSMLGYEPWKTMFGIPADISMFQARMTIMAQDTFEEADEDGGGSLDAEELIGVVKKIKERMGKPVTYDDGGREMRRLTREVDKAIDRWGDDGAIEFKDFLKMMKVEPWKTIFGVTEGLNKEKRQLQQSKKAEDRRHTKAFIKRLDVLRGVLARDDSPQVRKEPYATMHNTLSQEVDRYRPSGGVPVGVGGHNVVKAVLVSKVPRHEGPGSFVQSSVGCQETTLGPNYYSSNANPGLSEKMHRRLTKFNNDYYKEKVAEGQARDMEKAKAHRLCNRSIFASNHLKVRTRAGGGGRSHNMFPPLSATY